jgi:hypothetical protein
MRIATMRIATREWTAPSVTRRVYRRSNHQKRQLTQAGAFGFVAVNVDRFDFFVCLFGKLGSLPPHAVSFRNEPAIDDERLPRDVGARVARQKQGRAHQLFRVAPAVEDCHLGELGFFGRR